MYFYRLKLPMIKEWIRFLQKIKDWDSRLGSKLKTKIKIWTCSTRYNYCKDNLKIAKNKLVFYDGNSNNNKFSTKVKSMNSDPACHLFSKNLNTLESNLLKIDVKYYRYNKLEFQKFKESKL